MSILGLYHKKFDVYKNMGIIFLDIQCEHLEQIYF